MEKEDYIYCFVIAVSLFMILFNKQPQQNFKAEEIACIHVQISKAGSDDLRKGSIDDLKMDYAVCKDEKGNAVIDTSYDNFVNNIIAEYDEWRQ